MPRIRALKPEFFRSPDTAKVDFPVRIFYEALWCWADDFGVGETNINGLLGFAFPDEDGFTAQDVRRFCADCARHYGVTFYIVRGRRYYSVETWEKHQKLESREDRRKYPPPTDPDAVPDLDICGRADSAPTDPRGTGAGTGEQGNKEQGKSGGSGTEVCHQSADDVAPPDKCPNHINTAIPPSCGGCADARRNYQAWKKRQVKAEADELDAKRVERLNRRTAIDNCNICDENGMVSGLGGLKHCTHQEEAHA